MTLKLGDFSSGNGHKLFSEAPPAGRKVTYADTASDIYGISPKYVLEKEIFGFRNKLVAGLDYYNEPYKKEFFTTRERTFKNSMADLERESIGYYIRDELSILRNLILSAGYRYERTKIEGTLNDVFATFHGILLIAFHTLLSHEATLLHNCHNLCLTESKNHIPCLIKK